MRYPIQLHALWGIYLGFLLVALHSDHENEVVENDHLDSGKTICRNVQSKLSWTYNEIWNSSGLLRSNIDDDIGDRVGSNSRYVVHYFLRYDMEISILEKKKNNMPQVDVTRMHSKEFFGICYTFGVKKNPSQPN